jgi:hypothetical protein
MDALLMVQAFRANRLHYIRARGGRNGPPFDIRAIMLTGAQPPIAGNRCSNTARFSGETIGTRVALTLGLR